MSARRFVGLWLGLTCCIIAYAVIDLSMNPWLTQESGITLRPDLSQVGSIVHWGGRLLRWSRGALIANAVVIAGIVALIASAISSRLGGTKPGEDRVSIYPARTSVPPSMG